MVGRIVAAALAGLLLAGPAIAEENNGVKREEISHKVDSVMARMSLKEKVAQLFVVEFVSKDGKRRKEFQDRLIKRGLGGVIIMDDKLAPSMDRMNRMNSLAKIPLLVSLDGEWGAQMRYWREVPAFPKQMQLGSLRDPQLVYEVGRAIGEECRLLGFHINYAPDVDVNNNPDNPVIHYRSFGENPKKVAEWGAALMKGMQDAGTSACAKHFPGHGDTDVDSHKALPVLPFGLDRLEKIELEPFKHLIDKGVEMVMLGHLQVNAMDSTGTISSLSYPIITEWLKERMGFKGIICTDALQMKGVADASGLQQKMIPLESFKAGVDMLLMPNDVERSMDVIYDAVKRGEISRARLDESVRKILEMKARKGLLNRDAREMRLDTTNINRRVVKPENLALIGKVAEKSIILAHNSIACKVETATEFNQKALPLNRLKNAKVAYIGYVGEGKVVQKLEGSVKTNVENFEHFFNTLSYLNTGAGCPMKLDSLLLRGTITAKMLSHALEKFKDYDHIIVGIHNSLNSPSKDFGIDKTNMELLRKWADTNIISVVWFGTPYVLNKVPYYKEFASFVIAHSNTDFNNVAAAKILFGAVRPDGVMPVSAGDLVPFCHR